MDEAELAKTTPRTVLRFASGRCTDFAALDRSWVGLPYAAVPPGGPCAQGEARYRRPHPLVAAVRWSSFHAQTHSV